MERDRGWSGGRELIDFASGPQSGGLEFNARLSVGAVTLTHCTSQPIEGRHLGAAQITAAIHDGATFDMDWRGGESDRLRSSTVSHGRVHIGDGRLPLWVRCNTSPSFFAFAVEASFVTEIWRKGFDGTGDCFIGTSIGVEDPVIGRLAALGRLEPNEGGAGGRLYVEGLASALAVHLLRSSGLSRHSSIPHKGGLAPRQISARSRLHRGASDRRARARRVGRDRRVEPELLRRGIQNFDRKVAPPLRDGKTDRVGARSSSGRGSADRRYRLRCGLLEPEPFHGELPPRNRGYAKSVPPIASLRRSPAAPSMTSEPAAALFGHPLGPSQMACTSFVIP